MFRQRLPDVHILTRETTREQIVPLSEGLWIGAAAHTQLPDTWRGSGFCASAVGDGPGESPLARQPSVSGGAGARAFVFSTRTSALACDDILGLLRRYGHTPKIAREVGRQ